MKVVVNRCFGGFGLSKKAVKWMAERGDAEAIAELKKKEFYGYIHDYPHTKRADSILVECVETLGSKVASGELSKLEVVEIPDGIQFEIDDYDGQETIHETHRSW